MNNFLFEERVTKEYRRDMMAVAEKHNQHAHLFEKKTPLFALLLKIGALLY
ncbi:MAG: hypothetical protein HN736_02620 [Anaerolineae bacterium]|jgi:hypothetical protein|nr:hypothetical protein [Anaerolineae bacterium]MBT3712443.1 hypothetical protein [Anaerolineae bacterium]MBT4309983.1 hypothetical protein [Anaerolineae bacterium]MBT4457049.1 hypothetical protein [Anaerolineae bacterium]MBT6059726.1 hypothetical protein [Anaerolineae bacterium]